MNVNQQAPPNPAASGPFSAEEIHDAVLDVVRDLVADWDIDAEDIGVGTRLVADLEFGSVDIIYLVVAVEERFQRPGMGFQDLLMQDGRYIDDLDVGRLIEFVTQRLMGTGT